MSTAQLGMIFGLISIGAIFVATLIAFLVTCAAHPDWQSVRVKLPVGIFAASSLLIGISGSVELALRNIRRNDQAGLRSGLALTFLFTAAFLVGQCFNWVDVLRLNPGVQAHALALFSFYLLTGVHAVHVLAGLIPLAWVYIRASQREYSSSRHEGVKLCAQYWHFLSVMWLLLLAALSLV
jgi:cytochrome c oxidase subunit 3